MNKTQYDMVGKRANDRPHKSGGPANGRHADQPMPSMRMDNIKTENNGSKSDMSLASTKSVAPSAVK